MKAAIVTGATGFVGRALTSELLNNDYEVYAVCRNESIKKLPLIDGLHAVPCSLEEISSLKDKFLGNKIDVFFHLAWNGVAVSARADTKLQLQNAQWTLDALRVAHELGCMRFLSAGSIMEHETMAAAYTQGSRPGMGYIYGAGKAAAHMMSMSLAADLGIDLLWPEITNTYGPGERSTRLINTTIQKCIRGEKPQFTAGKQNYDFVYIDDVARAFRLIAENGKPFHEYLIGSSTARPLKEFLLEMRSAIAPELEFRFGVLPFTGINLPISKFDCSQTEADTGFRAQISFSEGCRRTMKWWLDTENKGEL